MFADPINEKITLVRARRSYGIYVLTQPVFTWSLLLIGTVEQDVKYV